MGLEFRYSSSLLQIVIARRRKHLRLNRATSVALQTSRNKVKTLFARARAGGPVFHRTDTTGGGGGGGASKHGPSAGSRVPAHSRRCALTGLPQSSPASAPPGARGCRWRQGDMATSIPDNRHRQGSSLLDLDPLPPHVRPQVHGHTPARSGGRRPVIEARSCTHLSAQLRRARQAAAGIITRAPRVRQVRGEVEPALPEHGVHGGLDLRLVVGAVVALAEDDAQLPVHARDCLARVQPDLRPACGSGTSNPEASGGRRRQPQRTDHGDPRERRERGHELLRCRRTAVVRRASREPPSRGGGGGRWTRCPAHCSSARR